MEKLNKLFIKDLEIYFAMIICYSIIWSLG